MGGRSSKNGSDAAADSAWDEDLYEAFCAAKHFENAGRETDARLRSLLACLHSATAGDDICRLFVGRALYGRSDAMFDDWVAFCKIAPRFAGVAACRRIWDSLGSPEVCYTASPIHFLAKRDNPAAYELLVAKVL